MNSSLDELDAEQLLAERVRKACVDAARAGFMDASISGLCTEGAMEAAISAIQKHFLYSFLSQPAFVGHFWPCCLNYLLEIDFRVRTMPLRSGGWLFPKK